MYPIMLSCSAANITSLSMLIGLTDVQYTVQYVLFCTVAYVSLHAAQLPCERTSQPCMQYHAVTTIYIYTWDGQYACSCMASAHNVHLMFHVSE